MSNRLLNEAPGDSSTVESAIDKAMARSPLTLEECDSLNEVDIASLIVEYNLSYPQAKTVMGWQKNEVRRLNAQSISYDGSNDELMQESNALPINGSRIIDVIREEIKNVFKALTK
tara:strand:- start:518 stop:865 length:348 start_codon:yes stop_codon:yes gene_type:complete